MGSPPSGVCAGKATGFPRTAPLHLSAREGCPGHCVTLFCASSWKHGTQATMIKLQIIPAKMFSLSRGGSCTSPSSTFQGCETALEQEQESIVNGVDDSVLMLLWQHVQSG